MTHNGLMRTVEEHRRAVADLIAPTAEVSLPVEDAVGHALAADLVAPRPLPAFDNSAMDGYAVRAADVGSATPETPVTLPVAADVPAGRTDGPALEPGTAHRIMTGAAMPRGADTIVQVEHTDAGTSTVRIDRPAAAGRHLRRAGEDVQTGETVLPAGGGLGPAQIALAAALGLPELTVREPVRVLVLSTGSELVEPGTELLHGQIHESNGPMLVTAAREAGAHAVRRHFVADDEDTFLTVLDAVVDAGAADLILTSGGVSAGAFEVVKDALAARGVEFTRVAMQPGKPQGTGRYRGVPVVTLPGNPVSAMVSFEVFVRPAIRAAMGFADPGRPRLTARLAESLTSPADRAQFRRGVLDRVAGTVTTQGPPGSHHLRWMAASNCLLEIPVGVTEMAAGDPVVVWDLEA